MGCVRTLSCCVLGHRWDVDNGNGPHKHGVGGQSSMVAELKIGGPSSAYLLPVLFHSSEIIVLLDWALLSPPHKSSQPLHSPHLLAVSWELGGRVWFCLSQGPLLRSCCPDRCLLLQEPSLFSLGFHAAVTSKGSLTN